MRGGWGLAALPGIFLSLRIRTMIDDVQSALSREGRVVGASLKVNLVLLAVAAIVVELFTVVSTPFLENVARAEVLQKARIMMEAAAGIRTYTSNEIAPLLNARTDGEEFHAQTIPAYAATKNFALLASKFRDYAYREAALNPMNLANRAVDWETDIINNFRGNPEKRELVTERKTDGGRVLHLAQPIISGGPCLTCHGSVEKAPRAILSAYGTENGFGWMLDEIVGAQIVSVPMAVAFADAAKVKNLFMGVLAGVFVLMIGLFNLLPILMRTVSQTGGRTTQITSTHLTMAESLNAFGYGLLAAGIAVIMVIYVVVYVRAGIGGLGDALNPFVRVNYVSLAAVAPGALIILLAGYLRNRPQSGLRPHVDVARVRGEGHDH
jgi:protein-histidine pros-kinase